MVGRRLLLAARVAALVARAPRGGSRWDGYWRAIETTGDDGDVLWDPDSSGEPERLAATLAAHAPATRPVVDLGCGNGRLTRALRARFAPVIGVDVAAPAVARAQRESPAVDGPQFRTADVLDPALGPDLVAAHGHCHVAVRGVLHVLPPADRLRLAATARTVAGSDGRVLIAETAHPGSLLDYLEHLGAGPRGIPPALARALASGLPAPARFGPAELEATFPERAWERLYLDPAATISTVPPGRGREPVAIAGLVAVLTPAGGPDQG